MHRFALFLVLFCAAFACRVEAASQLSGRITDESQLPLPGVQVAVARQGVAPVVVITGEDGRFDAALPPGDYLVRAELQGFKTVERKVTVGSEPVTLDLTLALGPLSEQVSVVAPAEESVLGESRAGAPSTISREVIDAAVLPNNTFDDVLPLLPNVIRGPDGLISVAGARAPQGQLLVNGLSQNDPVLGEPDVMLPLEAVDSVQVLTNGYPTQFGRATGGVTLVRMRSGSDAFHFSVNSVDPRLHFQDGEIHGIEAWEPNVGISGPLAKGRAWFSQGLDYRFLRTSFDAIAGTQESRYHALLSWTAIDWSLSPRQHITAWLSADPQRTDHANINAFTPASAVPRLDRGGWRAAALHRWQLGAGTSIESGVQVSDLSTNILPSGSAPYEMAHHSFAGDYFDTQRRDATRGELTEIFSHVVGGRHIVKAGGIVSYVRYTGFESSAPVEQRRSDGTLARRIAFGPAGALSADNYETAIFAQDTWAMSPALTADVGVRYDGSSVAAAGAVAPRANVTWRVDDRTTLTGGVGFFSDKVLLAAAAFAQAPGRTVTEFDESGAPGGVPIAYTNVLTGRLHMPWSRAWHVGVDRQLSTKLVGRIRYQDRTGYDEPVVDVVSGPQNTGLLSLESRGESRARSLETTLGYRAGPSAPSVYVSYVRSSAVGNLNDFASIAGNFREPFVQPDQVGPLAADVPNRLLAWGIFSLPSRITVAPFFELRNGFPYSAIDDEWRYVDARHTRRLPPFASLDLVVSKIVDLPGGLPLARIGLKLYNITGASNPRDVQRDIARPDFGATYNPIPREVRGIFEVMWGKK